jgi:5-methylthioadenosine/S-adenosylhomocysteine deaminase
VTELIAARRVVLESVDGELGTSPALLRLEGARIAAVRRLSEADYGVEIARLRELGERVHDFGDRLLSPAFVNPHTHIALGFLRGAAPPSALAGNMVRQFYFGIEARLDAGDVRAFARMGAWESLLHGVGLVWDHYYYGEAVAEALLDTGLAGVVAPTLQDLDGPGAATTESQLAASEAIAGSDRLAARGVFAALGPHATDTVSGDLWRQAGTLARRLQLPVHAHLAQSIEEHRFCLERRGRPPALWLSETGALEGVPAAVFAHALYVSRDEMAHLDPRRDVLVFCPHSQLVFGFPADPAAWSQAGLRWVVATDCSPSNDSMNLQKELRQVAAQRSVGTTWSPAYRDFLASGEAPHAEATWRRRSELFERALDLGAPSALLSRVWSLPGALHPAFRAGVLEPGALASFLVWDLDHPAFWPDQGLSTLAMGDTTQALHAMWVAGRQIGSAGDLQASVLESDAYRESLAEAEQRRRRLLSS